MTVPVPPPFPTPVPPVKKKPGAKQWIILGGVVVIVVCLCGALAKSILGDDSGNGQAGDSPSSARPADAAEPPEDSSSYGEYGTFDAMDEKGRGDSVLTLPGKAAVVTATHKGSANFSLSVLDAENEPTGDLLANTIGGYTGVTAYGLRGLGNEPKFLEIKADGAWTVKIAPIGSAPKLDGSTGGDSDAVYLYEGGATTWKATYSGAGNFTVVQYPESGFPNLAVNEIGKYEGTVVVKSGPSVVTVNADGKWRLG
ncbi:hypothetical protein Afil01_50870 [Actinorhabdospora filicis]|uniref:Uncharacterized protein n=1 Tax=Actinorhabdospora filicis TaxID=1785913 RepID=A0A9W6SQS4_9ACTN|nr:hypothetical protein [Actinorhabdospora filicis]GLZ80280.1 hypothetical protein Afil01_50870 [Actinorhabdospora filicis]